ncbi:glycosyltransferase [Rhizobium sp. CG4]|uniref:rhamnan synthesis F family protein n=1 Tax=Rhizobium sp. CG4 TaxID=2726075 RepID=UPI0020336C36|nr:rhamnan synthesis F family protein [Rhizobium sp. CG4]MCM2458014.1 glycosyltransferase [Rhizobium sp. CG4]
MTTNNDCKSICAAISSEFDSENYIFAQQARALKITAIEHYVQVGEREGAFPNEVFDPKYYAANNPDVVRRGYNLFWHYLTYGKAEGRMASLPHVAMKFPVGRLDPSKKVLIVLLHEASRTGAPILGWNIVRGLMDNYNVIVGALQGGPILDSLKQIATEVIEFPASLGQDSRMWIAVATQLKSAYDPVYAIANSSATQRLAVALEAVHIPVVALVHEFGSDMHPIGILNALYQSASRIVFPAPIVEQNSREVYSALRGRQTLVVPQGQSAIPAFSDVDVGRAISTRPVSGPDGGQFIVLGVGTVTFRKGPDLFVSVADYLVNFLGVKNVKFIWIGVNIPSEARYKTAIELQINRCQLEGYVDFIGEVDDLTSYYEAANILFISSRIDPLPNVGIDAMVKGLPIICFEGASGFSDLLSGLPGASSLIAPYANVAKAAGIIEKVSGDVAVLEAVGRELSIRAAALFDMSQYIEKLDAIGTDAVRDMRQAEEDFGLIFEADVLEKGFCFGRDAEALDDAGAVAKYMAGSRRSWPLARPFTGTFIRRPMVGFNPLIYDMHNAPGGVTRRDPFADFLSKGKPAGPWLHKVIRPQDEYVGKTAKLALHGHFHYPDLLNELIDAIAVNVNRPDLFLTTTSDEKMAEIKSILDKRGVRGARVWCVANKGRDILPFLKDMPRHIGSQYDVVGHIHGKKSAHVVGDAGDRWRDFAWQHLLGCQFPMIDRIASAFVEHPEIGLVFPEDPHLNGWDFNETIATDLAKRLGIRTPLPLHFDFPIGTMFWARPKAMQSLFDMPLALDEVPDEPVPIDGTILHAIERIVPFAVDKAGYSYATTHVKGVYR